MKKLFQKWIFAVIALAFLLTYAISFSVNTRHSELAALSLIRLKLSDAASQLDNAIENLASVTQLSDEAVLLKAQLFAKDINADSSILKDSDRLKNLCQALDVDELYVFKMDCSAVMAYPEEANERLVKDMWQKMSTDFSKNGKVIIVPDFQMQYALFPRIDSPGMIVVGDKPEHLIIAQEIADINNFSEGFRIGLNGGVLIAKDDDLICDGMLELSEKYLSELKFPQPLPQDGKSFSVTIHGIDYLGSILHHGDYSLIGLQPESEVFYQRNLAQSILVIVYLLLFTLIYILITILLNRIVLSGIDKVCCSLQKITDGNLNEIVNVHTCHEFNLLSDGINSTVTALKDAIAEAAKRLDNELALAEAIQCAALPGVFPAFPGRNEFDLYAQMTPAREIGGDFYDFFLIDDNHLAFLVADVSEKGIPAALFMMTGKTWLKGLTLAGIPPEKIFNEANRMLSMDNTTGMFITVFFGCLELSSGNLLCVNAGHNPPLLCRRHDKYEYLKLEPDFLLGTLPDVQYRTHCLRLEPGDRLFLYTDGVTEAMNIHKDEFGTKRLQEILNSETESSPRQTVKIIADGLAEFSDTAPQYDDVTMLALEYHGHFLELPALTESLPELQQFMERNCQNYGFAEESEPLTQVLIIAEEVFLNIASYAYAPETGTAKIAFAYLPDEQSIRLTFTDSGIAYDPLSAPEPEFAENPDELKIGGLGIFITRTMANSINYERKNNCNILTVDIAVPAKQSKRD